MNLSTQPYKGARDFYPEDKRLQKYIFGKWRAVAERYGYEEYDAPIVEPLDIYKAKTGEEIVSEQTFNFTDRGGREVTLRPEMTPSVSRMVAGRRQELAYPLRWYSIPNVWRYERPQKGRLREHWQLNVDLFGLDGLNAELEIIQIADETMREFGATSGQYEIRLNSRKLLDWLFTSKLKLSDVQSKDALKLIDKKHKMTPAEFNDALSETIGAEKAKGLLDDLSVKSLNDLPDGAPTGELEDLLDLLKKNGVKSAVWDISLVRGFDYYTDIVFEIFDTNPENNRSIFGGGRYDGLVGLFGVEPLSSVGFGVGEVTLTDFLTSHKLLPQLPSETDVFAVLIGPVDRAAAKVVQELRTSGLNIASGSTEQKADKQIKSAVKKGIKHALFIGAEELKSGVFTLKNLETTKESKLPIAEIYKFITDSKK